MTLQTQAPARRGPRPEASGLQHVVRTAVRAHRLTRRLDRQVDLGMRIPQRHPRHRAGQRQIRRSHFVAVLGVRGSSAVGGGGRHGGVRGGAEGVEFSAVGGGLRGGARDRRRYVRGVLGEGWSAWGLV